MLRWWRNKIKRKRTLVRVSLILMIILFADIIPYRILRNSPFPVDTGQLTNTPQSASNPTVPRTYSNRILLFGNSALIADDPIISVDLQGLLPRTLVLNFGQGGADIATEDLTLEDTSLRRGDIVIFYDGGIERLHNVYPQPFYCNIPVGLIQLLCSYRGDVVDQQQLAQTLAVVKLALSRAKSYTEERGATFIHIYQPLCLRDDNYFDQAGIAITQALTAVDPTAVNLIRYFPCDLAYFDGRVHTNSSGNQIIAHLMYTIAYPDF